jgi:hypothetical protein
MRLVLNSTQDVNSQNLALLRRNMGKQNIVVLVHANWCYHCQMFKPAWDQFCAANASTPGLLLVELENSVMASLAQHDQSTYMFLARDIEGFPTVYMYRTGAQERVPFNKERSVTGLSSFVKENAAKVPAKSAKPAAAKPAATAKKPATKTPKKVAKSKKTI